MVVVITTVVNGNGYDSGGIHDSSYGCDGDAEVMVMVLMVVVIILMITVMVIMITVMVVMLVVVSKRHAATTGAGRDPESREAPRRVDLRLCFFVCGWWWRGAHTPAPGSAQRPLRRG